MTLTFPRLERALCGQRDKDGRPLFDIDCFFPARATAAADTAAAAEVCDQCDDQIACFVWGRDHKEYGVWGGREIRNDHRVKITKEDSHAVSQ